MTDVCCDVSVVTQRARSIRSMEALYTFLYQHHGAYAVGVSPQRLQGANRSMYNG